MITSRFRFLLALVALAAFAASAVGMLWASPATGGAERPALHASAFRTPASRTLASPVVMRQPASANARTALTPCSSEMAGGMNHCPPHSRRGAPAGPSCPATPLGATGISCATAVAAMLPTQFERLGSERAVVALPPFAEVMRPLLLGIEFFRPPRA